MYGLFLKGCVFGPKIAFNHQLGTNRNSTEYFNFLVADRWRCAGGDGLQASALAERSEDC